MDVFHVYNPPIPWRYCRNYFSSEYIGYRLLHDSTRYNNRQKEISLSCRTGFCIISWKSSFSFRIRQAKYRGIFIPQSSVYSTWDDTYNGILIQELLSKTPLTHGLKLTPEEMMDYGTGAWYFSSQNPGNNLPKYVHYKLADVTLWDILPQHYYNNYMIAVFIFLFGWIPGLVLIGAIGLFYLLLFHVFSPNPWTAGVISGFWMQPVPPVAGSIYTCLEILDINILLLPICRLFQKGN